MLNRIRFFLLLLMAVWGLFMQPIMGNIINSDSVFLRINKLPDSLKAIEYNKMAQENILNNPPKAIDLANKALEFARKYRNKKEIGIALGIIKKVYNTGREYNKALQLAESYKEKHPEISMEYYKKALESASTPKDSLEILNKIGTVYLEWSEYSQALIYLNKATDLCKYINIDKYIINTYLNLAKLYKELNESQKALYYLSRAELCLADSVNKPQLLPILMQKARFYYSWNDFDLAKQTLKKIVLFLENTTNKQETEIEVNILLGDIMLKQKQHYEAIRYYEKAYNIAESFGVKKHLSSSLEIIGNAYFKNNSYTKALRFYKKAYEIAKSKKQKHSESNLKIKIGKTFCKLKNNSLALTYYTDAQKIAEELKDKLLLANVHNQISELYGSQKKYKQSLHHYQMYVSYKDSLYTEEAQKQLAITRSKYESEKKSQEIELLNKQRKLDLLEIKQKEKEVEQERLNTTLIKISAAILGFIFLLGLFFYLRIRKKNKIINSEKEKSDKLLLNILPERVANDLKNKGRTTPRSFKNVTVFFSDIVNFSNISSQHTPETVINELNDLFTYFDNIMAKHKCERIKTIGDAYMAVSGMPAEDANHAENIAMAALEIKNYLINRNKNAEIKWQMRIGIHSGNLVGGIVGIKKYIYDVFGNTINIASRMEANSLPMHINVSEKTYTLLNNKFEFETREAMNVKGYGIMNMYFLNNIKGTNF